MKITCQICNLKVNGFKGLATHLRYKHTDCTKKIYYDKYLKKSNEGICECGKECTFIDIRIGYSSHCSCTCGGKDNNTINRRNHTCMDKYGAKFVGQLETSKKKAKETCMKKYGFDNPNKSNAIKNKIKQVMLKKYGVENISQVPSNRKKAIAKMCKTMEESGRWISEDRLTEWELYKRNVRKLTSGTKKIKFTSKQLSRTGLCGQQGALQVDHCISIKHGFLYDMSPEEVAHPDNLQLLPWNINNDKKDNSFTYLE